MKAVCLFGSPRNKGNSTTIAQYFLDRAEAMGAEITSYFLNELTYLGCQGCLKCKTESEKCVVEDELLDVLDEVGNADLLVLTSPVYFGDVTSQLKGFIDRSFSYFVPNFFAAPNPSRLAPGKKILFVLVQGDGDPSKFDDIYPKYNASFKWLGFEESYLIRACGLEEDGDTETFKPYYKQADEIITKIFK